MEEQTGPAVPGSYWVVAVLGMLWNSFGAFDYVMTELRVPSYMANFSADVIAKLDALPVWSIALWALGVWGSFFGSVFMLLRRKWAVTAFLVSLVTAVLSFAYQASIGLMPAPAIPVAIVAGIMFFWWYCRRAATQRVLR